ncbi:hypothetical protein CEP52_017772, partial [Fusarium oligoseptatum]
MRLDLYSGTTIAQQTSTHISPRSDTNISRATRRIPRAENGIPEDAGVELPFDAAYVLDHHEGFWSHTKEGR